MARRTFTDTLRDIRAGMLVNELDDQLAELVREVDSTGKTGSLTLKIVVARTKSVKDAMTIKGTLTAKLPQEEDSGTLMFPTPEGSLSRKHPRQDDLPGIGLVKSPPPNVDLDTGEVKAAAQ